MRVACSTKLFAETSLSIEYHKGIQNQPQPQSYLYEYVCKSGEESSESVGGTQSHPPWRGDPRGRADK